MGATRPRGSNRYCFVVTFKPDQERRLFCSGQSLLIQPVVISAEIGIDQRANGIKLGRILAAGDHLVHGFLFLPRSEADQQCKRLRAAQRGLQLPYETSEYLLKRMPRDMRSLFEILDQLDEASLVAQRRLTIPFIRDALEKHARTKS